MYRGFILDCAGWLWKLGKCGEFRLEALVNGRVWHMKVLSGETPLGRYRRRWVLSEQSDLGICYWTHLLDLHLILHTLNSSFPLYCISVLSFAMEFLNIQGYLAVKLYTTEPKFQYCVIWPQTTLHVR